MKPRFFNRELSWIEFNSRVLQQALNVEVPLMERLQFLSIVTSNFDEFFQVRVASVKRLENADDTASDSSGLTPKMVLSQISSRTHQIVQTQHDCLKSDILPRLKEKNIIYTKPQDFSAFQNDFASDFFKNEIFPLLTPLRTDTEIFPNINNLSIYVAFLLKPISGIRDANIDLKGNDSSPRISIVKLPSSIQKILWLPDENTEKKPFALIEEIVAQYGTQLFSGFSVEETLVFKVARDADAAVDEDAKENFIDEMQKVLIERKSSFAVSLTCNNTSKTIQNFLTEKLNLSNDDVYLVDEIVDPAFLMEVRSADEAGNLSFPEWKHFYPADLPTDEPYWDILKQKDILLHVPYQSYDPVVKFISDAADDADVLAIKMTLYRTGRDSPIISALERAARNGKQVVVLVEVKARFDEERNIAWATELENAGVTVVYGLVNLKVHAKILMIMRRENDTVKRYAHLATGNYNPKTARLYSDLSIFTANYDIVQDATQFFNLVTGYSTLQNMKCLSMAPVTLKTKILNLIQREIDRSTPDHPGLIIAKMNSLTHEEVIEALYKASQNGVKVMLNVRGICMLIPHVKGLSENIEVVSIVDRYLEHSRIFYFQNDTTPEIYLSSADWMSRNLDRRIELMFPVLDKMAFDEVYKILTTYFKDNTNAMALNEKGEWRFVEKKNRDETIRAQDVLYKRYKAKDSQANRKEKDEFEVRR